MNDAKPIISINNVTKRFGGAVTAVDNVNLEIESGEFFALLGPSGCGKTTLLRMIAGFEIPSEGQILIDGQDMAGVEPNRRPINMVFQSYAVFPHMSVLDNVAYGLKVTGVGGRERRQRAEEALELVKLGGYGGRMPDQLSGGQRQRVALARALVKRPKVLLLDEPLSALDAKLREAMQLELVRLQETVGITFIIVTHDQSEALSMANRIAVMQGGLVQQVAAPSELYEFPNNRFVADFIGKTNLFEGKVIGLEGRELLVEVAGIGQLRLPHAEAASGEVGIAVRPEKLRLHDSRPQNEQISFKGTVIEVAYYGETSSIFIADPAGHTLLTNIQNTARDTAPRVKVGDELWCSWNPEDTLVLDS
ncbi:MAG: ABC transporter ATP-binding protein [Rhodovibrionaceae bacterium]